MSTERFDGKVIGITGTGSGMGRWMAEDLAARGAIIASIDLKGDEAQKTVDTIEAAGGKAKAYTLDVRDKAAVDATVDAIEADLGPIFGWVNSAGVSRMYPFLEHTEEFWDLTIDVNLKGTFLCCQAVVRKMIEHGGGVIVNMASTSGKEASTWQAAYCASKYGVVALSQVMAKELADKNIRVNMICPNIVHTEMWDTLKYDYAKKKGMDPEDVLPMFRDRIPMHRFVERKDVENTIVYLLSEDSSYLTGQFIILSGGNMMC